MSAKKKRVWSKAQLAVRAKYFTPRKIEAQKARKAATKSGGKKK